MTIEAELYDGTVLEFPDNTPNAVIQSRVKTLTAQRQQPPKKELNLAERAVSPGGVASPENIGAIGGGATGMVLGGPFGPPGVFLGGVLGAGTGGILGRGYEMLTFPETRPSTIPEAIGELGSAANRGMMGQAGGEVLGKFISSGKAALQRKFGRFAAGLPDIAQARRTTAAKEAGELAKEAAPEIPSQQLFKEVSDINPAVPLEPIREAGRRAMPQPSLLKSSDAADSIAEQLSKVTGEWVQRPNYTSFQKVRGTMRQINDLIGTAKTEGGATLGKLLQLKRGMWEAVENAADEAGGEAARKLKAANMASRNEYAMERTGEIIANATKTLEGREGEALNTQAARAIDAIKKEIRDDRWFENSFPEGALSKIMTGLDRIRQLPLMGAPKGVDAGSKQTLMKAIKGEAGGAIAGGVIGQMMGSPGIGAAIGGQVGMLGSFATAELVSRALSKPGGVQLVERLIKTSPQRLTPAQVAVLTTFIRGSASASQ